MDDVRALFFDVGGTVFDGKTTAIEAIRSQGPAGELCDALGV